MFAYVFWHTAKPDVPLVEYEQGLAAFSRALARCGCPGLNATASFSISSVPWLGNRPGFEDWTLVEGPGALEAVNAAAVSGDMAPLHARVAESMDLGHGGIYYQLWGDLNPFSADEAQWLTRPRGIAFRPELESITRSANQPISVWRRFMVLGPGREFLVLGRNLGKLNVPQTWEMHTVTRTAIKPTQGV